MNLSYVFDMGNLYTFIYIYSIDLHNNLIFQIKDSHSLSYASTCTHWNLTRTSCLPSKNKAKKTRKIECKGRIKRLIPPSVPYPVNSACLTIVAYFPSSFLTYTYPSQVVDTAYYISRARGKNDSQMNCFLAFLCLPYVPKCHISPWVAWSCLTFPFILCAACGDGDNHPNW